MTTANVQAPETKHRPSRRHQRVRRVLIWCGALAFSGAAIWFIAQKTGRDAQYKPGEDVEGITRELERGASTGQGRFVFTDATKEAGLGGFVSFAGDRTSQLPEDMGGGAAWGDFDNDGDDDLFLTSAGGPLGAPDSALAPSVLYENLGGGRFRQYAGFPELRIPGMGTAWADFDNDGWLDLAVTGYNTIRLFKNRQGRFEPVSAIRTMPGFWTGVSWGDFNRDGWPDLYVCGYVKYRFDASQRNRRSEQFGQAVPHTLNPSAYEPERNLLFQNDGKGGFTEVAKRLGVDNPTGRSLSGLWHDFDNNGWPDLYVANDISESKLYLNRGGKFEDAGRNAWVGEYRGSMGLAAGDFDRDGDDDLFISHWIAQQFALYESLLSQQKMLGADRDAGLHFTDVAEMKGIGQPTLRSIGWGAEFADLDSDGWLDLVVAAGSTFETETSPKRLVGMPSFLFWNRKGETFQPVTTTSSPFQSAHVSRGLAVSDYDGDGDLDVLIVDLDGGVRMLRNDTKQGKSLQLRLRGDPRRAWSAIDGAAVTAWIGSTPLRRTISSASYLSQSSRTVHIGLGEAKQADSVDVTWADGRVENFGALAAGTVWQLAPGQPALAARGPLNEKERQLAFWDKHRAAMDTLKRDQDPVAAARLFRDALALDPRHEDARYYLASCLAATGDTPGAMAELERLLAVNPASHRALQRLAYFRAQTARNNAEMQAAANQAARAHALNPEETGALLLLGEIELVRGFPKRARGHLERVVSTNHRAPSAHFLLAYLDFRGGRQDSMRSHLEQAVKARGAEWKPKGSAHEGEVRRRMHEDTSLLSDYVDEWDGKADPRPVFGHLSKRLGERERIVPEKD